MRQSGFLADDDDMYESAEGDAGLLDTLARETLSRGKVSEAMAGFVTAKLKEAGYDVSKDSEPFRMAAREFAKAFAKLVDLSKRRSQGEDAPTPPVPNAEHPEMAPSGSGKLPRNPDLVDYWARLGDSKREKSIAEGRAAAAKFVAIIGDLPLVSIQKAHLIQFRDARLAGTES